MKFTIELTIPQLKALFAIVHHYLFIADEANIVNKPRSNVVWAVHQKLQQLMAIVHNQE